MKELKSFVIGSSAPVFLLFFFQVSKIPDNFKNYSYQFYTMTAPLYFGFMNVLSLFMQRHFKLDIKTRYIITAIISAILVNTFAILIGAYNFDKTSVIKYIATIFVNHTIAYTIIYFLEKNICT